MSNERFASVWDAIESTPALAANMRLRSSLMIALKDHITREGLSQSQAAKAFGVTQPRVSDLMRGKLELFGLDSLVNMLAAAGLRVEMHVAQTESFAEAAARLRTRTPPQTTSSADLIRRDRDRDDASADDASANG
jgi:predicted XRE-type DNA-binding protein